MFNPPLDRLARLLRTPWSHLRQSVALKLMLTVGLAVLFVIAMYTYLISQMRQAWFLERMTLSQVLVQHTVTDYFQESAGQHDAGQTTAFLTELTRKTGLASIHLESPRQAAPAEPERATETTPTVATAALFGQPTSLAPTLRPMGQVWQGTMPIRNSGQCATCHSAEPVLATIVSNYPTQRVNSLLVSDRWRLAGYASAVLVLVLLLVLIVTWWLVLEPLYRLTHAVSRVRQGELEAECELDNADQFGRLAEGFNDMLRHLRARQRELCHNYEHTIARAERLATVGQLASGLAHEIKNPLHGIAGALEIIASRLPDQELREVTAEMKRELERVVRIINDLLSYARPKSANQRATDFSELLRQTCRLLQADAAGHQITLQCQVPSELPPLWIDPEKLRQILLNLMLNAIQMGHTGGRVTVSAWRPTNKSHLVIEVDDDGPGVPAENRHRLFEPFFTTRPNGHGLGLSITRLLAEQYGGTLALHDRPGPGACFRLTLPLQANAAHAVLVPA